MQKLYEAQTATIRLCKVVAQTDSQYLQKALEGRITGPGSRYEHIDSVPELQLRLFNGAQLWVPYEHPAVLAGCEAFKASHGSFRGTLGVVELQNLSGETMVSLEDPKSTGKVTPVVQSVDVPVKMAAVYFSVAIIGPKEGGQEGEMELWTVHPGDPIQPSRIPASPDLVGKSITVAEAIEMGLVHTKIV